MSMWARAKSVLGGDSHNPTLAAAASMRVPDDTNYVRLTGTATVTNLDADPATRNRLVIFEQVDGGATTFTNTDDAVGAGLMDLGGTNITLGNTDILVLYLLQSGEWLRIVNTNN